MLSLGVLLLLAAGVTFLAVTWDSLPITLQAAIMATLAAIALACAVPAAKHKLTGTAEALAILGTGLLAVDLYGIRELGLISPSSIDGITYAAAATAIVAAVNLLMTRFAPTVVTFGVATVLIGQLPLPLLLAERVDVPLYLLGLLLQVIITLLWSGQGTKVVRTTGAICSALFFTAILIIGSGRVFLALIAHHHSEFGYAADDLFSLSIADFSAALATTGVICLSAATGILLLRKRALPASLPPTAGVWICTAAAAFTIAAFLPQIPTAGRWLTTALATALVLTDLLRPRTTTHATTRAMLQAATITVVSVNLFVCLIFADVLQLGLIAAIVSALAPLAAWRRRVDLTTAATVASLSAQVAILLTLADGYFEYWTGGIALAVVGACSIAFATRYSGLAPERALLVSATSAVFFAELIIAMVSPDTGTGIVLTIAAAPLMAYGMRPGRREALLIAGLLLAVANTAFVLGSGATTIEWFTVPPAIVVLAIGLLRWRDQSSWIFLGPSLLIGLTPSALIADGNDVVRTTLVIAAALAVILIGVRFTLQAPFIIGATVLAKIGLWQFVEVAPLIPRWITLALAGAVLLAVGATYERRLLQAKEAARWLTNLR